MSIFGGSERFPDESARSPGPIYGRPDVRAKASVVMKGDYKQVDEHRKWGKRETWIGGPNSPHMPVVSKDEGCAPGHYNNNVDAIKKQAPKVSFPKSSRFLSQKISMTDRGHQRELIAAEGPGPKYNVDAPLGRGGAPRYSFAPPHSPRDRSNDSSRLPSVDTPQRGHRESWLSAMNRNGVLVMPSSPPREPPKPVVTAPLDASNSSGVKSPPGSTFGGGRNSGSVFGNEHRFGARQEAGAPRTPRQNTRVQFVSARHTRENMGEFSPGPIYAPATPECPGGRLAPSPSPTRRPPASPRDARDPHANPSSRSSWLAGAVRKADGHETVLLRTGDVPPGPGSYAPPPSSFSAVSHNVKARGSSPGRVTRPTPPLRARPPVGKSGEDGVRAAESTDGGL